MILANKKEENTPSLLISLKDKLKNHKSRVDWEKILLAFECAKTAHEGQKRLSGDPYIVHPVAVAEILADQGMDEESLITALLHDVVEDTEISLEDVKKKFGEQIAFLLDGVTKISQMNFRNPHHKQSENIRKMMLAMSKDVRVILIKLADRLHNLQTLEFMPDDKRVRIARETLDIYTPLASRLGMSEMKSRMEDLSFSHYQPLIFEKIHQKREAIGKDQSTYMKKVVRILNEELKKNNLSDHKVQTRYKNIYSIHKKMQESDLTFEQIHDVVAFRVLVESIPDCYEVLGLVHALWKPIPSRIKDFIAVPKRNGYQSLHSTVMGPEGRQIEIQIRTHDMHLTAEKGVAAHWIYKMSGKKNFKESLSKFNWLQDMVKEHQEESDSDEFLQNIKSDLFESEIYVYTPNGDIKELPKGATPIDFAYSVHTQIGERTTGVKVNGVMVTLNTPLKNGDTVEVMISKTPKPSKDWLKFCVSSKARSNIKSFFNNQERMQAMEIGKNLFEKGCLKYDLSEKKLVGDKSMQEFIKARGYNHMERVYIELGFGKIHFKNIMDFMNKTPKEEKEKGSFFRTSKEKKQSTSAISIENNDHILADFAKCCYPVPGDHIKAYVNKKRGIVVHRAVCKSLDQISQDRFIDVNWDQEREDSKNRYNTSLILACADQPGALSQVSEIFNIFELNIFNLQVQRKSSLQVNIFIETKVRDLKTLSLLLEKLNLEDCILSAKRRMEFH